MTNRDHASRRAVLVGVGGGVAGSVAGCLGSSGSDDGGTPLGTDGEGTTVESLPAPVQGDPDADVTVMAFEDYACPHCRTFVLDVLPDVEAEYVEPGVIRYEHHDYPIPVDGTWSWATASAARAVQDTVGDDAFFAYSTRLFERMDDYSLDLLGGQAEAVGADPDTVERAARQGTYRPVLEADKQRGQELDLTGTPQIYVNGEKTADYAFETIAAAIEDARP